MNTKQVQDFLYKKVGEYSTCVSDIKLDNFVFQDAEIDIILAKRRGWESHQSVVTMVNNLFKSVHVGESYKKQVSEIAIIMLALQHIYYSNRGIKLSIDKSYYYATLIYAIMCPNDSVYFHSLVEFKSHDNNYAVIVVAIIILLVLGISVVMLLGFISLCS
jgi:hypothetical protein